MRGRWAAPALLLVALLPLAAAQPSPNEAFILTNSSTAGVLRQLGTYNQEVIFTTFKIDGPKAVLYMLRNFAYWLQQAGVLKHTLMITQDEESWRTLLSEDLPCFLDRASPTERDFPEGHRYARRTFDYAKNYWALRFAEAGYTSLYLDTDVVTLKHPFKFYQPSYDIQGLSDYRIDPTAELPQLGEILTRRCGLYALKKGNELEGGDLVHPAFELEGEERERSMRALTPCMSLGLWFLRPTSRSLHFLRFIERWIIDTHRHQWDQAAWNEVLMGFTVGMGDEPPLKLRLLPVSHFANIEIWEERKKAGLPVDPVILHAGYLKEGRKVEKMVELGFWRPDDVDHAAARQHLQRLNATLGPAAAGRQGAAQLLSLRAVLVMAGVLAPVALVAWGKRRRPPIKLF